MGDVFFRQRGGEVQLDGTGISQAYESPAFGPFKLGAAIQFANWSCNNALGLRPEL